jgi:colanic acid/amylovoran biosynthesis glycosyltransferase
MKKLVFFSNGYPYNQIENWSARELAVLCKYFDDIVVAPLVGIGDVVASDFPKGIRLLPPLFRSGGMVYSKFSARKILNHRFIQHAAALKGGHSRDWRTKTKQWLIASLNIENILRSDVFRRQVAPELAGSCLYFYWAAGYAEILPFFAAQLQRASLVRFHGYDLHWNRNNGYIPSQRSIVESAAILAPISKDGANFLRRHYPSHAQKIRCKPLGTSISGMSRPSGDGTLRLVSCAYATPVKRLHLIAECLRHIDRPTEWTHIGDGPLLPSLIELVRKLPAHVSCNFVGRLQPDQVATYYDGRSFDVFINVSESEGIPVSVMEAMAAGIPVVATNVGGTPELVDDRVGRLLPASFTPSEFVSRVNELVLTDAATRNAYRARCRQRVANDYDITTNSERMAQTLLELCERIPNWNGKQDERCPDLKTALTER